MGERDGRDGTAAGGWGRRVDDAEFQDWLARIHREAWEHTERIRARSGIPSWLLR